MNKLRYIYAILAGLLVFTSCGDANDAEERVADQDFLSPAVVEPERPAYGERSLWSPARPSTPEDWPIYLEPWLSLRASALKARGGLLVVAFEDGSVAAHAASPEDPYRFGLPDEALPEPLWTAKLPFTADRLEILDGSQVLAIGAGPGTLALLSGADGSVLATAELGSSTRFAPASTRGSLALASEDALFLLSSDDLGQVSRLPLPSLPAASPTSALGRFALLLMDGTLVSVGADGASTWTAAGLDFSGGLACDGGAWYALDGAGSVTAFAFADGARIAAPSGGPWLRVVGVDRTHLSVIDPAGSTARIELQTGTIEAEESVRAGAPAELDPDALFAPAPEIAAAIAAALSKYRPDLDALADGTIAWRVWSEGAAAGGGKGGPAFFAYRYEPEDAGAARFEARFEDDREVLIAVFSASGEELVSNIGEHVDPATQELPLTAGAAYWIVAGELGEVGAATAATLGVR